MNTTTNVANIPIWQNLSPENLSNETWLPIKNYEGYFSISNLGRVRSEERIVSHGKKKFTRKLQFFIKKQSISSTGYLCLSLGKNGKCKKYKVHQLMAIVFLNHTPCGLKRVIDHIDGNPLNNQISNLRIISNRENTCMNRVGKSKYLGSTWAEHAKKWRSTISYKGKVRYLGYFDSEMMAHERYWEVRNKIESNHPNPLL